jgi:hypothetical protein
MGGMFGEFTASLIDQGSTKFVSDNIVAHTKENRFLYPNYLAPINFHCKTYPRDAEWNITEQDINYLNELYQNKWICLPTHWYSKDIRKTNLPSQGIAMFSTDPVTIRLSYSLFWIKSHAHATTAWPDRMDELQSLIDNNHPHSQELIKLQEVDGYQNWKYLAYKFNILKEGKADLRHYIYQHFAAYEKHNITLLTASSDWFRFDIGQALHGDMSNIPMLENYLDVSLNRLRLRAYSCRNLDILKNYLGLTLNDLSSKDWIDVLYNWVEQEINHTV